MRRPRWVPRHLPRRLRRLRKSRGIYRDVCAGRASTTAFALAFAGVPASLAAFALAFAGVPASLTAFALAFAGVPASPAAFALAFAGVPQASRQMPWYLRGLRKRLGKCRGTCAACANVSVNAAELARPAQTWGRWGDAVVPLHNVSVRYSLCYNFKMVLDV